MTPPCCAPLLEGGGGRVRRPERGSPPALRRRTTQSAGPRPAASPFGGNEGFRRPAGQGGQQPPTMPCPSREPRPSCHRVNATTARHDASHDLASALGRATLPCDVDRSRRDLVPLESWVACTRPRRCRARRDRPRRWRRGCRARRRSPSDREQQRAWATRSTTSSRHGSGAASRGTGQQPAVGGPCHAGQAAAVRRSAPPAAAGGERWVPVSPRGRRPAQMGWDGCRGRTAEVRERRWSAVVSWRSVTWDACASFLAECGAPAGRHAQEAASWHVVLFAGATLARRPRFLARCLPTPRRDRGRARARACPRRGALLTQLLGELPRCWRRSSRGGALRAGWPLRCGSLEQAAAVQEARPADLIARTAERARRRARRGCRTPERFLPKPGCGRWCRTPPGFLVAFLGGASWRTTCRAPQSAR